MTYVVFSSENLESFFAISTFGQTQLNLKSMKRTLILLLGAAIISTGVSAQKIKLVSGKLGFLKSEKSVAIVYDYSGMGVGKFKNEQDYLDKKTDEYNKKEAGKGDQWAASWEGDRATRFQPKFEELLNKNVTGFGPVFGNGASGTDVVMKVRTTFTEPGYNIVISRQPAMINIEVIFSKGGKDVAKITLVGAPGSSFGGYDYDTGVRISEAYAKAGKELGKFIVKTAKKG